LWQSLELQDPEDAEFRDFVLATLEQYGDQAPGEVLAALIQNAPSSEIRRKALELLAEASQELSVHDFNVATDDPDSLIRDSGLAFFDNLNNAALLDATAQAAQDSDDSVRMTALSTLEEMSGFTPVWEVAETLMDDADPQVRLRALELLMYGDAQTAINWLVHALADPDPAISERAEALLAELEQGP
jgi:HEAT repeat protein